MWCLTFVPPPLDVLTLVADTSVLAFARIRTFTRLSKVKKVAGNNTPLGYTIAGIDTQPTMVKVLAEDKPGKAVGVLPLADGIQGVRKGVQATSPSFISSQNVRFKPLINFLSPRQ